MRNNDHFIKSSKVPTTNPTTYPANTFNMRFFIWAFATVLGLALASPIEAGKGVALSSRSNNCFTLCKIDGGVSSSPSYNFDFSLIPLNCNRVTRVVWRNAKTARAGQHNVTEKRGQCSIDSQDSPRGPRVSADYVLTN